MSIDSLLNVWHTAVADLDCIAVELNILCSG